MYDGHGSTRLLTDSSATITDRMSYDAYGMMLRGNPTNLEPTTTNLLYSGEQFDVDLQQQYLRARWYDQNSGRFNRLDPFSGNNFDPPSLHKYAYVHGDPVNGTDPTGLALLGNLITVAIILIIASSVLQVIQNKGKFRGAFTPEAVALLVVATFTPGIGEALDLYVLFGSGFTVSDRLLATGSFIVGAITLGLSPNFGALRVLGRFDFSDFKAGKAGPFLKRSAELAEDTATGSVRMREGIAGKRYEKVTNRTITRSTDPDWDFNDPIGLGKVEMKGPFIDDQFKPVNRSVDDIAADLNNSIEEFEI